MKAIKEAIANKSAHDIADALDAEGVDVTKIGPRGSDCEACDVSGYGKIWYHDLEQCPGWVAADQPISDTELVADLAELAGWIQ